MAFSWWNLRSKGPSDDETYAKQIDELREKSPIPSIWLFGKTGSGKSSIVQFLTGAEEASIGEGYRPETKTSRRFDFPDSLEPLLSFLDTRGLAEAGYDPRDDLRRFSQSTQLMIVTTRVADHALDSLIEPLRRIRKDAPERPVILVLTCLHEATGRVDVSEGADPFDSMSPLPSSLQSLVDEKTKQFAGLCDGIVPVDLTRIEDGFADPNFGGRRLKDAILAQLPHAYRQALLALKDTDGDPTSLRQKNSRRQILASSAMAATAGAVPVPWVDIPAVLAIQAHLAVKVARIYEQEITPARWAVLSSAAGSRIAVRFALRGALKFIPFVGMAAGAASSFAFTYALGMSWDWYFADLREGNLPDPDQLRDVFVEQLKRGHELWKAD
ncbi:YcjF family protein [Novipirellula artificiosorum]|uniref:G domain-containing protein n=1 Tax=Novipirellula artificiosorum TaxID=2528016 RepID=A0A5C6DB09_9BACT|nr:GTPase [Novipirellula artificiosorum]TWU34353.1 hypothetical protein Poly41_45000 [Novipirellula artificiosorum]